MGGRLPPGIYGKILKDILSLDVYMEKLLKSFVPAKTLLRTHQDQAIRDEGESAGEPVNSEAVNRTLEPGKAGIAMGNATGGVLNKGT
jgi:hypothetical protein